MSVRTMKVVFVAWIALLCLLYAVQNVVNLEACYQAFAYVMGAVDHQVYTELAVPAVQSPALIWLALVAVIGLEFLAGALAARGAWDMWKTRSAPAAEFNGAKKFALLGCGTGIIVWLGLFAVLGGALFAMWQTEVGRGSLENAFQFFGSCALVFLIVNSRDD
jgi:predicted small integral membrane protein